MKFRVLRGIHSGEGNTLYRRGSIVETNIDLVKRFNQRNSSKFERVSDDTPASKPERIGEYNDNLDQDISFDLSKEGLSKLTLEQLKKLAYEEGIELSSTKKDDIINEILGEE